MAPQPPEPPQSTFTAYNPPGQAAPNQQQAANLGFPPSSPLTYPGPAQAPQTYQPSQQGASPNYQAPQQPSSPHFLDIQNFQAPPAPQPAEPQQQPYRSAPQPAQPQAQPQPQHFGSPGQSAPQNFSGTNFGTGQGFQAQPYQGQNFADASFPEPGADASFPETNFDQSFGGGNFAAQDFAKQNFPDANFGGAQNFDASFPETSFPAGNFGHQEQQPTDGGYGQAQSHADQSFQTFSEEPAHDYSATGEVPQSDPRRQLQAFDALYDQPPQIQLGATDQSRRAAEGFYESERMDADFLDETQVLPPPSARGKFGLKSRSVFMVGSALLGAIALGGALAFAYKQSGGALSGEPPLVTADSRPVKEAPDQPGGKEFPHKNKLIYDRLTNADEPESERLVPRQENVAVPAMPQADGSLPTPVASTDLATQSVGEPMAVASVGDTMPDGGPRKVKTMVVKPDGSVVESETPETGAVPELPAATPPAGAAMPAPEAAQQLAAPAPAAAPPAPVAAPAAPAAAPEPKPEAKPTQTAAVTPQPAAAPTKYVVQVASKKNQTEALASFADMQQKYPSLLASYKPIVQKADLGDKGVWYRLRIGPIADKSAASKLCSQLKQQGLPDCLVMAAQ